MSDLDQRVLQLEQRVAELEAELGQLRGTLLLVGDVQRYSRLRDLLAAGDLDAADRETARLLLDQLMDRDGDVSPESLERCPAAMLAIIDGLWQTSSEGRQGFAVQQRLYRELGGSRDTLIAQDTALFEQFTRRVAWPTVAGVGFALPEELTVPVAAALDEQGLAPPGHLPLRCWASDYGLKAANLLMARLIEVFAA
ncbi:GUN4 domain-containing protein [Cyanobium sp. CH-040]|uniref:GUN4 domain-containing protein n=1 Tax=Cyanobium sp. CH-040 TaxID=2823708 RepID=UPI0020CFCDE3|nr:GUN4 domain-containing protein [Cyanobium sp. CH-040]MCP9928634.1 GUN4 domain-containing protein [Cyanobium sp. CH-040]